MRQCTCHPYRRWTIIYVNIRARTSYEGSRRRLTSCYAEHVIYLHWLVKALHEPGLP